jgi:hypothetical protein
LSGGFGFFGLVAETEEIERIALAVLYLYTYIL